MEDILAILLIFGGGTLVALGFSPIGRAVAEIIRRRGAPAIPEDLRAELQDVRAEVLEQLQGLRHEMNELAERMDFAERLLAKTREAERLAPPAPPH